MTLVSFSTAVAAAVALVGCDEPGDTAADPSGAGAAGAAGAAGGGGSTHTGGGGGSSSTQSSTPTGSGGDGGGTPCVDVQSDPKNCGVCGHDCLGGACLAGTCQPVQLASGFSVDDDDPPFSLGKEYIVWRESFSTILAVSKSGGPVAVLLEDFNMVVGPPAAGDTHAYLGSVAQGTTGIWKIPFTGGAPEEAIPGPWSPWGIVLDGPTMYFHHAGAGIHRVPIAGGTPSFVIDSSYGGLTQPPFLVDSTSLFWSYDYLGNASLIMKAPKDGGEAVQVSPDSVFDIACMAQDDGFLYWTEWSPSGKGDVSRMAKTGGTITKIAVDQPDPMGIAVDETWVYWANRDGGAVLKAPKGGGAPLTVASGQASPLWLAVDETAVFWMTEGQSGAATLMKIAK